MYLIPDTELLELLLLKPEHGLKVMMDTYVSLVYTIVHNQLISTCTNEDIEECVSDIFLHIFNYRSKINLGKGSIKKLLSTIAKRKAIDFYRKTRGTNNNEVPIESIDELNLNLFTNLDCSFIKKERNKILLKTIKSLGALDKEILIRKYYLCQPSKDISKTLGLKSNTIDKRSSRCIEKLKYKLRDIL